MAKNNAATPFSTTSTIIKFCTCESPFQDKRYGKHKRVHNIGKDNKHQTCTVCGSHKF